MMPADAIAMLDRALARNGSNVLLRHMANGTQASAETVRAFIRGYKPDEVIGSIQQGDSLVIISPTGLVALPKQNDKIVVGTRVRNVQSPPVEVMVGDQIVRIELLVRGG
jgi:hypothetical protein